MPFSSSFTRFPIDREQRGACHRRVMDLPVRGWACRTFRVIEENHSLSQIQAGMPYAYSLVQRFGYATNITAPAALTKRGLHVGAGPDGGAGSADER